MPVEQRIALAEKQLASPEVGTRLAAIAELERAARESEKDGARISALLVTFLHKRAACLTGAHQPDFKVAVSGCETTRAAAALH